MKNMNEDNKNELYKILYDNLSFYKKNDIDIHIVRKDGRFYNGSILELAKDFLILDDDKLGAMPIRFLEIDTLEKREEKK